MITSINLPIAEYRFTYKALDDVSMPDYSGKLWHSVLGKAMRQISCMVPEGKCEKCMFAQDCDYGSLFRGIRPPDAKIMRRYPNVPTPHIFRIEQTNHYQVAKGNEFSVRMVLPGKVNQKLPAMIRAMHVSGQTGFRNEKKRAQLVSVVQHKEVSFSHPILVEALGSQPGEPEIIKIPEIPDAIRIQFQTPYKPSGKASSHNNLVADLFIMAVIRRISLLHYFYTGSELEVDYPTLKRLTETIPVSRSNTYWKVESHHQRNANKHNATSGWMGYLDLTLKQHAGLWSFLYLGQWLNVGKNASMGFGQYQIIDLTSLRAIQAH